MSDVGDDNDHVPRRFRRLRFNPLRDVLPFVAVGVGVVMAIQGAVKIGVGEDPLFLLLGLGLAALGVVVFSSTDGKQGGVTDLDQAGPSKKESACDGCLPISIAWEASLKR